MALAQKLLDATVKITDGLGCMKILKHKKDAVLYGVSVCRKSPAKAGLILRKCGIINASVYYTSKVLAHTQIFDLLRAYRTIIP